MDIDKLAYRVGYAMGVASLVLIGWLSYRWGWIG